MASGGGSARQHMGREKSGPGEDPLPGFLGSRASAHPGGVIDYALPSIAIRHYVVNG